MGGAEVVNKVINQFLFKGIKGGAQSISSLSAAMKGLTEKQTAVNDQSRKTGALIAKGIAQRAKESAILKVSANNHAEIRRVMQATGLSANQSARAIKQLGFTFNKAGFAVDALGKRMKLTNKTMTNMRKTTRRFNMGFLSLMFAAMALNRVVGTFLRSAIGAYAKASGETNNFRKETNKLVAAWEFFKFSLIDALSQSEVFQRMITFLTELVQKMNALTPGQKTLIIMGIGFLFIASAILMVVGQIGLAGGGIQVLGDMIVWVKGLTLASFGKMALGILKFVGVVVLIIAAFIFLKSLIFGFDEGLDEWASNWQRNGGIIAKVLGGIIRLFNFAGEFFRVAFANAFDTIALNFQGLINFFIRGINIAISGLNALGANIKKVPLLDFGALDRIVVRTTALMDMTPTINDLFTGEGPLTGPVPQAHADPTTSDNNTTTIDSINFNIDGTGNDIEAMADEIMEKLNESLNVGLDSSNI